VKEMEPASEPMTERKMLSAEAKKRYKKEQRVMSVSKDIAERAKRRGVRCADAVITMQFVGACSVAR